VCAHQTTDMALPDEIMLRVFALLDAVSLGTVSSVCTSWLRVAKDDALWQRHCASRGWPLASVPNAPPPPCGWRTAAQRLAAGTILVLFTSAGRPDPSSHRKSLDKANNERDPTLEYVTAIAVRARRTLVQAEATLETAMGRTPVHARPVRTLYVSPGNAMVTVGQGRDMPRACSSESPLARGWDGAKQCPPDGTTGPEAGCRRAHSCDAVVRMLQQQQQQHGVPTETPTTGPVGVHAWRPISLAGVHGSTYPLAALPQVAWLRGNNGHTRGLLHVTDCPRVCVVRARDPQPHVWFVTMDQPALPWARAPPMPLVGGTREPPMTSCQVRGKRDILAQPYGGALQSAARGRQQRYVQGEAAGERPDDRRRFAAGGPNPTGFVHVVQQNTSRTGAWIDSGCGSLLWQGQPYQGEWRAGRRHGTGIQQYAFPGAACYEGQWCDGVRSGRGRYQIAHGGAEDLAHHNGKQRRWQRFPRASKSSGYEGEWRRDKAHGYGHRWWTDGRTHQGYFVAGHEQGHGVLTKSNGACVGGIWRSGTVSQISWTTRPPTLPMWPGAPFAVMTPPV